MLGQDDFWEHVQSFQLPRKRLEWRINSEAVLGPEPVLEWISRLRGEKLIPGRMDYLLVGFRLLSEYA